MPKRILILTPSSLRDQEPQLVEAVKKAEPTARVYGAFSYFERKQGDVVALRPDLEPLAAWAVFAGAGTVGDKPIFTDYVLPWDGKEAEETPKQIPAGRVNTAIVRSGNSPGKGFGVLLFDTTATEKLWWLESPDEVYAQAGASVVHIGADDASSIQSHVRAARLLKEVEEVRAEAEKTSAGEE